MTPQQKEYIENNIDLITSKEWDKFFPAHVPVGLGGILYEAEIDFLSGVDKIPDHAFQNCKNITSIVIPEGITRIGDRSFAGCENLKSITIPSSVTSIDEAAFMRCKNLTSINIPNNVTSISNYTFLSV